MSSPSPERLAQWMWEFAHDHCRADYEFRLREAADALERLARVERVIPEIVEALQGAYTEPLVLERLADAIAATQEKRDE